MFEEPRPGGLDDLHVMEGYRAAADCDTTWQDVSCWLCERRQAMQEMGDAKRMPHLEAVERRQLRVGGESDRCTPAARSGRSGML